MHASVIKIEYKRLKLPRFMNAIHNKVLYFIMKFKAASKLHNVKKEIQTRTEAGISYRANK